MIASIKPETIYQTPQDNISAPSRWKARSPCRSRHTDPRWAFDPLLGFAIKSPQTETLRPAALPFEVVHQRPMEISLHGPVEIDRAPHLMDMLREITRAHMII